LKKIGAIAAMTKDRVIGLDNKIPWHYSEDFKRFKRVTLNSSTIMGRKTWESIRCKALPQRRNIVISRKPVADVEHYHSIADAVDACKRDEPPIWFIGGGYIYTEALSYCTHLDITTVPDIIDPQNAVLFPEIDPEIWHARPAAPLQADPRLNVQTFTRK
jgi:dihydrofolate reductase